MLEQKNCPVIGEHFLCNRRAGRGGMVPNWSVFSVRENVGLEIKGGRRKFERTVVKTGRGSLPREV